MNKYINIDILNQNNEGEGICKINGIVTFVPYSLPNENVDLEIVKSNKNYNVAKLLKVNLFSNRKEIKCPYYYECGGCNLMHQKYEKELLFKKDKVLNNLKRIGNIELNNDVDIVSCDDFNYRNHITLSVYKDKIGFFKNNTNTIVNISSCVISKIEINKIINDLKIFVSKYKDNNIKKISIKSYSKTQIDIISDDFKFVEEFKSMVKYESLYINHKYVDGLKNIEEILGNYKFKISPESFFQKNTIIAKDLYDYVKSLLDNENNVLDLYCGTGSIGIYVSEKCNKVIGIEEVKSAINDANENALINNINNIKFICGKVEDNIEKFDNIDVIIVDPPRTGLDKKTIENINKIKPNKIIYISCNSTTLARDLKYFDNYNIKNIKLFDMFPNTHHVETVIKLVSK